MLDDSPLHHWIPSALFLYQPAALVARSFRLRRLCRTVVHSALVLHQSQVQSFLYTLAQPSP